MTALLLTDTMGPMGEGKKKKRAGEGIPLRIHLLNKRFLLQNTMTKI